MPCSFGLKPGDLKRKLQNGFCTRGIAKETLESCLRKRKNFAITDRLSAFSLIFPDCRKTEKKTSSSSKSEALTLHDSIEVRMNIQNLAAPHKFRYCHLEVIYSILVGSKHEPSLDLS
ncbi:hypothetical protein CHS0354_033821 [Potamilus streckersoni]|uniref:Uncharacterized protein n=1 Tax=Potamilus streckersoni TaxID=2493646 RepID=A0AAE0T7Q6_9BIVA|nr:hypothetical protein CHS0354_033821 [Potamilus streckersoni]